MTSCSISNIHTLPVIYLYINEEMKEVWGNQQFHIFLLQTKWSMNISATTAPNFCNKLSNQEHDKSWLTSGVSAIFLPPRFVQTYQRLSGLSNLSMFITSVYTLVTQPVQDQSSVSLQFLWGRLYVFSCMNSVKAPFQMLIYDPVVNHITGTHSQIENTWIKPKQALDKSVKNAKL